MLHAVLVVLVWIDWLGFCIGPTSIELRFRILGQYVLVGSLGTIIRVFYIFGVTCVLHPLHCVQHPNGSVVGQ